MSLHKLTAGTGYTYLTRQVAAHDHGPAARASLASYYTEQGETPGRWVGSGLAGIDGLQVGDEVTEEQMRALFGTGLHPLATQRSARLEGPDLTERDLRAATRLGATYKVYANDTPAFLLEVARRIEDHAAALGHPRDYPVDPDTKASIRTAVATEIFTAEHGRPPSGARELASALARYSRPRTRAVAGFDLTFSPVKSVSALWALAPPEVAAQIELAHHDAVRDALTFLEQHALFTREGTDGVRQVETTGLVAAAFTHRDSRAGDPDLHTHVAVANKVQACGSGSWLAIDGRILYKAHVSASETYNTALEGHLRSRLGVRFTAREHTGRDTRPVREIDGVDPALLTRWSSRRHAIDTRRGELAQDFQRAHGRPPTSIEAIHLAQQATLETREDKHPPRTLAQQRAAWRLEADEVLGPGGREAMVQACLPARCRPDTVLPDTAALQQLAQRVLEQVQSRRATWQVWHVRAEALRQVRAATLPPHLIEHVVDTVTAAALVASVRLSPGGDGIAEPPALRRSDGSSVYEIAGGTLHTSAAVLAAEQRIIAAAGIADRPACSAAAVDLTLLEHAANGTVLNAGQAALVRGMATSAARVQLALAPAGAGKTTAMRALTAAWLEDGGDVVGLAPSAAAATVLRESTGAATDTLAKLNWSLTQHEDDRPAWVTSVGPRTLVIVDEAAMADTLSLDAPVTYVLGRGGQVRLIGDTHQLAAIGAGGVLRDIADTHGALHLTQLMRFTDPAEGMASLALREGRPEALGFYLDHGRVHVGDPAATTEQVFSAWVEDCTAGRDSLMLAPTRDLVTALNRRAQAHRLGATLDPTGVPLADGAVGHIGDIVITRRNDRRLRLSSTDWVKNGDRWSITHIAPDGSLTLSHSRTSQHAVVPSDYVRESVELGYATTTHAAQGVSVDTVHGLATGTESRQQLYTLLTRGADANHLYLQFSTDGDPHRVIRPDAVHPPTATDILEAILARDDAPRSATTLQCDAAAPHARLQAAVARYTDALHVAAGLRLGAHGLAQLGCDANRTIPGLTDEPAWPALRSHLALLAAAGTDPRRALESAAERDLTGSRDRAAVLDWRLDDRDLHRAGRGPLPWLPPIPAALGTDPEWDTYLRARRDLVVDLAEQVRRETPASTLPASTLPAWWPEGRRVEPELLVDVTLWRAAAGVNADDHRATGPRCLTKTAALWQRTLDARLGTDSPALAEWGTLLHSLAPSVRGDDFTLVLALRLAAVSRAGVDARALLATAVRAPLPDDHAAAALWWRISRHLSPAVALQVEAAPAHHTEWLDQLTRALSAEQRSGLQASPWWPALVATLEHSLARGNHPADLERHLVSSAGVVDPDLDACQALTWRLSVLADPPPDEGTPRPEDFADAPDDWAPPQSLESGTGIEAPVSVPAPDIETRLTAAALVRSTMGVQPLSESEIEHMVARAAAWDDAPFTPQRAAELNALAREYYSRLLDTAWAGDYLRRRLRLEIVPPGAGYAPPGWTHLTHHMRSLGASDDELIALGLSSRAKTGRLIDRFRDRLLLPIEKDGITLGFVGRRHPDGGDDHGPKYLNTPTTVLFHKGDVLYGMPTGGRLNGAVPVVVEGPIDALAVTTAGDEAFVGVAPLGTALTAAQARLIAERHTRPVLAFDHDPAGRSAAERAFWMLAPHGVWPREARLPTGEDPSSVIESQGREGVLRALTTSRSVADRLIHELSHLVAPDSAEAAIRITAVDDPERWTERIAHLASQGFATTPSMFEQLVTAAEEWNERAGAPAWPTHRAGQPPWIENSRKVLAPRTARGTRSARAR
ncbi:MobF family relaxase [Arthrobacter sp. NEB 688]|uniref:MobF family relaxase n=1 Tax=Arthrobacter sp. NEB 688 TaxID=904039 RepID=UPI0015675538|nr:MobF family relaxase [Arthrobacter sp. NEB 688]QKE85108.1 relaxase domain-containing protein [Arthrobacter sp. NEB 688]